LPIPHVDAAFEQGKRPIAEPFHSVALLRRGREAELSEPLSRALHGPIELSRTDPPAAPDLRGALLRAMTFMIVASPCAVVLATTPAAIALAGRHGVLVKSAVVMERLGEATMVAFDKTGTLTEGMPWVTVIRPVPGGQVDVGRLLAPPPVRRAQRAPARRRGGAGRHARWAWPSRLPPTSVPYREPRHRGDVPADRAEVYARIGLRLTYQPGPETVIAEVISPAINGVDDVCPRGDCNHTHTWGSGRSGLSSPGSSRQSFGWLRPGAACHANSAEHRRSPRTVGTAVAAESYRAASNEITATRTRLVAFGRRLLPAGAGLRLVAFSTRSRSRGRCGRFLIRLVVQRSTARRWCAP